MSTIIEGVEIKELLIHKDERGVFGEIIRNSDKIFQDRFAQLSFSVVFTGVAKAWHLHQKQTEWICALQGDMKLALSDTRKESKTQGELMETLAGETFGIKVIRVPPGVAHGYKVINGPLCVLYLANREYDPADDLRIPHDDPGIGYDWETPAPIK